MIRTLFLCLVLASGINGILAGVNLDRYIVQVPAFRRLPIDQWVEYVRVADLRTGLVWYPLLAVLSLATTLSVDWFYVLDPFEPALATALDLTTVLVVGGLIATMGAAPTLLRLRRGVPADGHAVFVRFHRWGLIRAACQTLAFVSSVWALLEIGGVFTVDLF